MKLTKRQREILTLMCDNDVEYDDSEIVREGGVAYLGLERISIRIVNQLLLLCAISLDQHSEIGKCERYHINETGRKLLSGTMRYPQPLAQHLAARFARRIK